MEYVPTKLNESVMEKMSKLEDQEESLVVHSAAIKNSSNLKRKNSKKVTKIGVIQASSFFYQFIHSTIATSKE